MRRWEVLTLMFMNLPIMGHVVLIPALFDVAGRDVWLSIAFSLPFGLVFAFAVWRIMAGGKPMASMNRQIGGKYLGGLLNGAWFLYFAYLGAMTLGSLMDMLHIGFYPETPMWYIGFFGILLAVYGAWKGLRIIAWISGLLTISVVFSGHMVTFLLMPERDWRNLLPLLQFGWGPSLSGSLLLLAMWTELLTITFLPVEKAESKGFLYVLWFIVVTNVIMSGSVAIGSVMVFGLGQAENMTQPALSMVRIISLGFIDRFDVYGLLLMVEGTYIRLSLLLSVMSYCLPQKLMEHHRGKALAGMGGLLFALALFMIQDRLFFENIILLYVVTIGVWLLPMVLLLYAKGSKWAGNKIQPG